MKTVVNTSDGSPMRLSAMRETVNLLLAPESGALVQAVSGEELATVAETVRRHLELLIPEVERAARKLNEESIPRCCALACVGEARGKLRTGASHRPGGVLEHVQRLARVLNALCDHYETIGGEHA
ncbi:MULTISPECIES: DUF6415 family natural product biosynthesis protein [Streptomyces]|uniref:DUF6415 family natural product biosynthesis protein n=1 Tax=Streptomyces sp. 900129855 TaxID=3155129 RepID=A0ABV2ZLU9_9ACTN